MTICARDVCVHLDGGAVGVHSTLDIETLGIVAVGVDLVSVARRRWRWRSRRAALGGVSAEGNLEVDLFATSTATSEK